MSESGSPEGLPFGRLAIIGMGLIGSSIARAARHYGAAETVVACDIDAAVCERVKTLAFADVVTASRSRPSPRRMA